MSAIPLWQRGVGLACLLLALLVYEPAGSLALTAAASVLALVGAYLATRAVLAIALGAALIALFFARLTWPLGFADYVLLVAGSTALALLVNRFRARMQATHEARWSARRGDADDAADDHQ